MLSTMAPAGFRINHIHGRPLLAQSPVSDGSSTVVCNDPLDLPNKDLKIFLTLPTPIFLPLSNIVLPLSPASFP